MRNLHTWLAVFAATVMICGVGCKKSAGNSGPTTFTINGASDVTGALDRKDFAGAVQAIMQVKASLTEDKRQEYNQLLQRVKDTLVNAMATNDAAIKAYQALRFIEAGR